MKPTKNKVFCHDCERIKMLFDTESKAENFIKFNTEEILSESGYSPQRSYYCIFCEGWHTTSIKQEIGLSKKEKLFEQYQEKKNTKIISKDDAIKNEIENQIKELDHQQIEIFFSENINILNNEIEIQINSEYTDKKKLKELRKKLVILYIVRKQNGYKKINNKYESDRKKEIDEWMEKLGY